MLLPPNDQCVPMEDPLTTVLDRIQAGKIEEATVRYFSSRVRAGETAEDAVEQAAVMVRRSFAAYKARRAQQEVLFEQKVEALKAVLANNVASPEIDTIAASTGLSNTPLLAVQTIFTENPASIPTSVVDWIDWITRFFISNQDSYLSLLGDDADIVKQVVRGRKTGGPITIEEFGLLNAGLRAWVTGLPFQEIELALGVAAGREKSCPRARDLVLKLANRSLYLIAASFVEVAKLVLAAQNINSPKPAVLETLAVAIRKGLDTPDKVAFAYRRPALRSRVVIHRGFAELFGTPLDTTGLDYATVLTQTTARLAFAGDA